MKLIRSLDLAAARSRLPSVRACGAERPDQRRRGDVPVPDLFEVVLRVQQAASRASQINYQSIGSGGGIRQLTNADGLLRRDRRADDRPSSCQAAPGTILHFPTVLGARRARLQHPGRRRAS